MLTNQAIKEFQKIYSQTYGRELSSPEATEQATQMIRLYKVVLGYHFSINQQSESQ